MSARSAVRCVAAALALTAVAAAPAERFALEIPGIGRVRGDEVRLPDAPERLVIHVSTTEAEGIEARRLHPRVNGQAAATVADVRRGPEGLEITLDLGWRDDLALGPGVNTVEIVAESRHGRRFYRNWLVRVEDAGAWWTVERRNGPAEERPAPPSIELLAPAVAPRIAADEERQLRLLAEVTAYHPLDRLELDGRPLARPPGSTATRIDEWVALDGGTDEIVVRAGDERGNETLLRIPVHRIVPAAGPRLSGRRWALVVGIGVYEAGNSSPPLLPTAARGATGVARSLADEDVVPNERMLLLVDSEATCARLLSALHQFLARPAPDDLLIVYVAGWGLHDGNGETYLACHDTRTALAPATALPVARLRDLLDREEVRAVNQLLLFDIRPLSVATGFAGTNLVSAHLLGLARSHPQRAVIVSSAVGEGSASGLFTRSLETGLAGAADLDGDRIVAIEELVAHVADTVTRVSGEAQTPMYRLGRDFPGDLPALEPSEPADP